MQSGIVEEERSRTFLNWLDAHVRAHGIKYVGWLAISFMLGGSTYIWGLGIFDAHVIRLVQAQTEQEIEQHTSAMKDELKEVEKKVDDQDKKLDMLLLQSYRQEITEVGGLLCKSPESTRLREQLAAAKDKYEKLAGHSFSPPACP